MTLPTNINFWSEKNYMKRDSSCGSTSIVAPVTPYGLNYRTTLSVPHNLGYVPLFRVYYEPFKDGIIYPAQGSRLSGSINKVNSASGTGPICIGNPTTTTLEISIEYFTNALTGLYPIYYVIYKDYQLA